jgi:hypothetical protein
MPEAGAVVTAPDKGAVLSPCGTYRYHLWRRVGGPRPGAHGQTLEPGDGAYGRVAFVMLNPSTADASVDDPTIRKCVGYARRWGYEWLDVVNLFALRATDPRRLHDRSGLVRIDGPENNEHIVRVATAAKLVVCSWGRHGALQERGAVVLEMLRHLQDRLCYLKLNKDGSPGHPLYTRGDLRPRMFMARPSL